MKAADGINVANQVTLKWGVILDYLGGPTVITRVLKSERMR